jgi:MYXO-CTERM domain-containing protein
MREKFSVREERSTVNRGFVSTSLKSVALLVLLATPSRARAAGTTDAGTKTLIDYFLPTPIVCPLTSNTWGAAGVIPRDTCNGLEDATGKLWTYWDGQIVQQSTDGKYHIVASRWAASKGFNAWPTALAVHGISNDTVIGSYVPDANPPFTFNKGEGQNVVGAALKDGSYIILDSPGNIYQAASMSGPWTNNGVITITANGFSTYDTTENQSIWQNADGSFFIMTRPFEMMLSATNLMGPYLIQGGSVLPTIAGLTGQAEDPVIWCSGGQYHMVANWWSIRKAWHLTSDDGIHNWKSAGLAYDPTTDFVRYTDGTVNHWYNMERAAVFLQNGHVVAFSFAVSDVEKTTIVSGDNHLSKIIVVPFDGVSFDRDNPGPGSARCPLDLSAPPPDAGPDVVEPVDAGHHADATAPVDAGHLADGSSPEEAAASDVGIPPSTDAAVGVDASHPLDAAVTPEAGSVAEAGREEAGGNDGGSVARKGVDAGAEGSPADEANGGTGGGCACETGGARKTGGTTPLALLLLSGMALAVGRRRRRAEDSLRS